MWDHDCKVEKTMMSVGDGEECNWCGETQDVYPNENNKTFDTVDATKEMLKEYDMIDENSIENVEVKDNPDGSASVTMDITPEAQQALMKQGLQYLIEEMKMADKVIALEANEFSGNTKTWELSDDDANALFHFGFIKALKMGMGEDG